MAKTRPKMSNYAVFAFAFMHLVVNFNGIMQLLGPLLSFPSWNIMTINFHRIFLVKFQEKNRFFDILDDFLVLAMYSRVLEY